MKFLRSTRRRTLATALLGIASSLPALATAQQATPAGAGRIDPPAHTYWVYVGAESADLIHRVRFGPQGIAVEKTIAVGEVATEMEGPHGLQISPDGKYLYMTTGHGVPDGKFWKYEVGPDTLIGLPVDLGWFPASLDVTPDGLYALVVNFNLHGEMVPSSVSVVHTPSGEEVARTTTCTMPHGSRVAPGGRWHYSACMMDDQLVELDTRDFEVSRRFSLAKGAEGPLAKDDIGHHAHAAHGMAMPPATCSPTWAQPSHDGAKIFVACNRADEILEVDRARWTVTRRFATGRGPYNLAVTADGRLLVATLKQGSAVQVFDLRTGRSVMTEATSTTVAHGVVVSPDSRYAFVSVEGVGAEPGKVDVYDLRALARVASAGVGQQASGITFWRQGQ